MAFYPSRYALSKHDKAVLQANAVSLAPVAKRAPADRVRVQPPSQIVHESVPSSFTGVRARLLKRKTSDSRIGSASKSTAKKTKVLREVPADARPKIVTLLTDSLQKSVQKSGTELDSGVSLSEIAKDIEEECFAQNPHTKPYKAKVRSLAFNLKDSSSLVADLLSGLLTPKELAGFSTAELANPDLKNARAEQKQEAVSRRVLVKHKGRASTAYTCPLCQSNATTFIPLARARDISKCETWGYKDTLTDLLVRVTCDQCHHEWQDEEAH